MCFRIQSSLDFRKTYQDAIPYVTLHLQWDLKSSDVQNKHLTLFRGLFAPQKKSATSLALDKQPSLLRPSLMPL